MRWLDAVACCGVLLVAACGASPPSPPESCVGDGVHSFAVDCRVYGQRAVITFETRWSPECILRVDVRVDGQLIGTAYNGGTLYWDSRMAPDGEHVVTFEAPGWAPEVRPLWTDNTPPRVLSCVPRRTTWGDPGLRLGIDMVFDEPVYPGEYPPPIYPGGPDYTAWNWVIPVPDKSILPAHLAVDLPYWGDWVGNDPVPVDCGADYGAWLAPWGDGPIPGLEGSGRSLFRAGLTENEPGGEMILIEPGGRLQWLATVAPEPWVFQATLESSETSRASQLTGNVWLETAADGTQAVRALQEGRGTAGYVNNLVAALEPSRAPFVLQRAGQFAAAWTERGDDGRRAGRVAIDLSDYYGDWLVLPPIVASPGMEVRELHATWYPGLMACYVEAEPGGPGLVRAVWLNESWQWADISKHILNRDPAHSASEPAIQWNGVAWIVAAWVEDGQVLASVDDWWNPEFGPPAVLNRDQAAPARSPRILLPWERVVFVEEGLGGDRFEVRQLDDVNSTWHAWTPIETGGRVVDFDVNKDTAVTIVWSDDAGNVRLRVFNE